MNNSIYYMKWSIFLLLFFFALLPALKPVDVLADKSCVIEGKQYNCPDILLECPTDVNNLNGCGLAGGNAGGGNNQDAFPPGTDPKTDINSCCRLRYTIKFEGITFPKGCVVGAHKDDKGAYCLINGNNVTDQIMTPKTEDNGTGDPCMASQPLAAYKKWGMVCLLNTVHSITNWTFYIMMAITVFLVVLAGYYHMTALGDPEKASKARNLIWFSIIGLLLGLLAYFIPAMVMMAAR